MSLEAALGVDVGASHLKMVRVTRCGHLLRKRTVPTPPTAEALVDLLAEELNTVHGSALGVAAPGLAACSERAIAWMRGRLDYIEGLDFTERLACERQAPVLNDAHAALLGEAWLGAARGAANAVLLTLGTGVGGAALVEGRLMRGQSGRAGHFGHICLDPDGQPDMTGTPGSLEDAIGECTLARRTGGRFATTRDLLAAVEDGDQMAEEVWSRSIRILACGIASLENALDPEIVVLGGGIATAAAALLTPLRKELEGISWRPTGEPLRIVTAELGEWAGACGAAWRALQAVNEDTA